MKFTDLFVRRPVLAIVVNLVILIAGLQSIRALSVRQYPRSDIAIIRVSTAYVGANADLVRGFITTPLEQSIARLQCRAAISEVDVLHLVVQQSKQLRILRIPGGVTLAQRRRLLLGMIHPLALPHRFALQRLKLLLRHHRP